VGSTGRSAFLTVAMADDLWADRGCSGIEWEDVFG